MMPEQPTHLDAEGTAHMVDVSQKQSTQRTARAVAFVKMGADTFSAVRRGDSKKGDVVGTARLAGIMAAKRTGDLIPLCHPIGLSHVDVRFAWLEPLSTMAIACTARCAGQTGVEMEAITGATMAALTVYDMVKGIDRGVVVSDIHVASKAGGKSGEWQHEAPPGPNLDDAIWT
jgi:cyclic pyranopterin phosphate synthase